jgi:hypothetical protein
MRFVMKVGEEEEQKCLSGFLQFETFTSLSFYKTILTVFSGAAKSCFCLRENTNCKFLETKSEKYFALRRMK